MQKLDEKHGKYVETFLNSPKRSKKQKTPPTALFMRVCGVFVILWAAQEFARPPPVMEIRLGPLEAVPARNKETTQTRMEWAFRAGLLRYNKRPKTVMASRKHGSFAESFTN